MRIGMFSEVTTFNAALPNGISSFIEAVSPQLVKFGHTVHIFEASLYNGQKKDIQIQDGIYKHLLFSFPVKSYHGFRIPVPLKTIFKGVKWKFDVIHAHGPINGTAATILAKNQGVVKVITYHSPGEHYRNYVPAFFPLRYNFFVDLFEKWIYNSFDLVLTPANKIRQNLVARGFESQKLFVLPNCVNLDENHKWITEERMQSLRNQYGLNGKKIVSYVGRMSPEKRIPDIIRIVPQVIKEEPETHFLMIGKGPYLQEYQALAQKVAPKDITFTGFVPNEELSNLLQLSQLGVIFVDGAQVFDITLLNYWANHLAVCARRAGGMGDVITHGNNGMLFKHRDEALEQIISLLQDERKCKALAIKGYETVKQKYSVEAVTRQMLDYYKLAATKYHAKGNGFFTHMMRYFKKKR
ncbi:MAG: glycosyltransferase [Candidatus Helarchaeota archaeon]